MRGKTLLKRLFYGQLKPIPRIVDEFTGDLEPLRKVGPDAPEERFKFLYMEAQRQLPERISSSDERQSRSEEGTT